MNRDLGVWASEDCALVLIDYQEELLEAMARGLNTEQLLQLRDLCRSLTTESSRP